MSWQCWRDSWPRNVSSLLRGNVTGLFGALSVFGRRIKGRIRLRPEQVWTSNMTSHHRPPLCSSFHSWCFCLEVWCESVVLRVFLSVFVTDMEWTERSVIGFIETQRQCQPYLNRNGFLERSVLFRDFFLQSHSLKIQIHWETFWWNCYITHWPSVNSSLPANLDRCTLPCLCTVAFVTTAALFYFSLTL